MLEIYVDVIQAGWLSEAVLLGCTHKFILNTCYGRIKNVYDSALAQMVCCEYLTELGHERNTDWVDFTGPETRYDEHEGYKLYTKGFDWFVQSLLMADHHRVSILLNFGRVEIRL